uniref:Uncharacterized protein n=1 Tax=Anopheles atroparvus TaxID=41427 RepID=A0AAG5DTC3_ANOAO
KKIQQPRTGVRPRQLLRWRSPFRWIISPAKSSHVRSRFGCGAIVYVCVCVKQPKLFDTSVRNHIGGVKSPLNAKQPKPAGKGSVRKTGGG